MGPVSRRYPTAGSTDQQRVRDLVFEDRDTRDLETLDTPGSGLRSQLVDERIEAGALSLGQNFGFQMLILSTLQRQDVLYYQEFRYGLLLAVDNKASV